MRDCSVDDLRNMVSDKLFNKTIRPYKFSFGTINVHVSDWTELSIAFLRWLIDKDHLNQKNIPIHNHAMRGKYFINSQPIHKNVERNGNWHQLFNYYIDTKYNAECHVRNILTTLDQLGIYHPDIKVSFRRF